MSSDAPLPPSIVRRAATIARGPHACPSCECPTWTEPPVPWTGMRDYLVRCDACERPIMVRIDRERMLRRDAGRREALRAPDLYDPVVELLERRDARAFGGRVLAALPAPALFAGLGDALDLGTSAFGLLVVIGILVGSLWGPAVFAMAWGHLLAAREQARHVARIRRRRPADVVEVSPGRWDQWAREQRRREREVADRPDAVLEELGRVLDERELRRVRILAERGEVAAVDIDDLLRFRKAWSASVA